MALAWFWGMYPPGQWVVFFIVGSAVIGALGFFQFLAEGDGGESWRAFVIAPFSIFLLALMWTVLLGVISVCQWLWTLGVPA